MPIPLDAGSQIADHLIVILIGFPEQSKVRHSVFSGDVICNDVITASIYFFVRKKEG